MRTLACLVGVSLATSIGCGGGSGFDIAPVSGIVTLDGEPLAGAMITFMPRASGGPNAGPASIGETDSSGKFMLTTADGESGAVVATHQIMITTVKDSGVSTEDDNVYAGAPSEKVPPRYNSATTLTFDVPAAGSTAANFELTSGPK